MSALVERIIAARDALKRRSQDVYLPEVLGAMADVANTITQLQGALEALDARLAYNEADANADTDTLGSVYATVNVSDLRANIRAGLDLALGAAPASPADQSARPREHDWKSRTLKAEARVVALEEGLRPFAKEADGWGDVPDDEHPKIMAATDDEPALAEFTVGDLFRARELLTPTSIEGVDQGSALADIAAGASLSAHETPRQSEEAELACNEAAYEAMNRNLP